MGIFSVLFTDFDITWSLFFIDFSLLRTGLVNSVAKVLILCRFNLKWLVRTSTGTTVVVAFLNLEMTMNRSSSFLGFDACV